MTPPPRSRTRAAALAVVASVAGCAGAAPAPSPAQVPPRPVPTAAPAPPSPPAHVVLAELASTPPLDRVHWGVLAVEAATGRVLAAQEEGKLFVPASNQKLLVTAAAMERLGPGWRWTTDVWAAGPVRAGVLDGDLVLRASGDPTLSSRYWPSSEAALDALADSLIGAGVREVTGRLVVDASRWDSAAVPGTWQVYDLPWRYAAGAGAFAVAEGETWVEVRAGRAAGSGATVTWWPVGEAGFVEPRLVTIHPDSAGSYRPRWYPESRRIVLEGEVRAGRVDTVRIATRDPVRQGAAALERALERRGVRLGGGWHVAWEGEEAPAERRLASLESPPLSTVVQGILEPSQNWMAEQLLITLGREAGAGASREAGIQVVRDFLVEDVGIDSLDFEIHDGSGMSPYDLVTPRAVVALLRHVASAPWGGVYRRALAEPGEKESTMENRMQELAGRLFVKTGSLSPAVSLSGWVVREDGSDVVFSILVDNSAFPGSVTRAAIDRLVRALAGGR